MKKIICVMVLLGMSFMGGALAHELKTSRLEQKLADLEGLASEYSFCFVEGRRYPYRIIVWCNGERKFYDDIDTSFESVWGHVMDTMIRNSGMEYQGCRIIEERNRMNHICDFMGEALAKEELETLEQKLGQLEGLADEYSFCFVQGRSWRLGPMTLVRVICRGQMEFHHRMFDGSFETTWTQVINTMTRKSGMLSRDCRLTEDSGMTTYFCDFIKP